MFKSRMFLSRANFNGRWSSIKCIHCGKPDTDEHLFICSGYGDLMSDGITYNTLFLSEDMNKLYIGAGILQRIYARMETLQGI